MTIHIGDEADRTLVGIPRTVVPQLPRLEHEPDRVRIGFSLDQRLSAPGAIAAAVALGLLIGPVLGIVGIGWVPLVSFVWFLGLFVVLVSLNENRPTVKDRFWAALLWSAGGVVVTVLTMVIGYVLIQGWSVFKNLNWDWSHNFFTTDMGVTSPLDPITKGGIFHAFVGTMEQITIALVLTVPLGIATAIFLNEIGGRYARIVRTIVEAMTALPSVIAGLFIYASVILLFTKQFDGFAAALAITVLMLPIMIRSADVVMRLVPGNLREAGLALGAGQWSVVRRVVLPTARSGLMTAIILATAHGIGETAPVLLTAGFTGNLNWNPFSGPQVSLPLAALEFAKAPQKTMQDRGYATAATLLLLVLVLFVLARLLGGQQAGQVSERQRRRRAARSLRDRVRVEANYLEISRQLAEMSAVESTTADPRSSFPGEAS